MPVHEDRSNDISNTTSTTVSPELETVDNDIDEDTLRVMVSTDNHLGYCERDTVRGLDSFAAFEEVLFLAKRHRCDLVLLAGDLFHENKPTRRTLHKTMEIIRRYCMGPSPVQFQIVSDQRSNFRSAVHSAVNYEDQYYSVDLPIFSIHGNHDDPTRDGGTEMLAALDLLAVTNLVNYFGRQDEVDKVEVSPILIKKGTTRVALYGMGSMRDERLNRMWQGKKVRFLRAEGAGTENDDDDEEKGDFEWFNIFALHQNRDLGRGSKNCVHESMIPEWMDLVVWGHEHECLIHPTESAVGTFRITQPGSSVATSLTGGESQRKHVGILDIRGPQFRMRPIPLSQVRSFAMGEFSLQDRKVVLDPEDPKVDDKMTELLAKEVERLITEARESAEILKEDAVTASGASRSEDENVSDGHYVASKRKFQLEKPDQVLVRLKVEHSGFSTLNTQRFGARFVSEVANPSDILLFHRRRTPESANAEDKKGGKNASMLQHPIAPDELAEMNVEDLVQESLDSAEKKLELLDEKRLGIALEDFVSKEQRQAIGEAVGSILSHQQKKLIKRGASGGAAAEGEASIKITTATALREVCMAEAEKARFNDRTDTDDIEAMTSRRAKKTGNVVSENVDSNDDISMQSDADGVSEAGSRRSNGIITPSSTAKSTTKPRFATSKPVTLRKVAQGAPSRRGKTAAAAQLDDELVDDNGDGEIEIAGTRHSSAKTIAVPTSRPPRKAAAASTKKGRYTFDDDDDDSIDEADDDSDDIVASPGNDDDDEDLSEREVPEETKLKKRGRDKAAASSAVKQKSQLTTTSFTSTRKTRSTAAVSSSRRGAKRAYQDDDDSDEDVGRGASTAEGWGTAGVGLSQPKRGRR